jgi:hypothetical protein
LSKRKTCDEYSSRDIAQALPYRANHWNNCGVGATEELA